MLIRVGAAEVGGLIEMVEWDEPYDIAWHSVTGVDQRGRFRIREQDNGSARSSSASPTASSAAASPA